MNSNRINKVNEEMKRELSLIIREMKDPRISLMTSVVFAKTTPDLKFCKVYISVLGSEQEKNGTLKGLKNGSSFIRREVGQRLNLRNTPQLSFVLDDSIEKGVHISEVLRDIKNNKKD